MFSLFHRERSIDTRSDADLHRAALKGSDEAMAALYRRHGPLVFRYTLRMSNDRSLAEEITQEVFLALLRQSTPFDPQRAMLSTWLCGIARNQLWRHLERSHRFISIDSDNDTFDPPSPDDDPAALLTRAEAIEAVRDGLDDLPLPLKEVILLCEFEEFTYQQASLILAVPIGTVRSRLHRAKARLAPLLRGVAANAVKENTRS